MYAISKGPSKQLVEKTRKGFGQKIEIPRDLSKKTGDPEEPVEMSSPRPVFHSVNGKRSTNPRSPQETITPHHEEIIKYVYDAWSRVHKEFEMNKHTTYDNRVPTVTYYQDTNPNPDLQNFKPFDLECFWGQRLYKQVTQST
uniref:Protein FAM195A n=1 Tax=Scolopendra viridis TaxID=118503 RepID=A0A4D5RA71_SCOVI